MADVERERQKLKDLLDAGFIFEEDYKARIAALNDVSFDASPYEIPTPAGYSAAFTPSSPLAASNGSSNYDDHYYLNGGLSTSSSYQATPSASAYDDDYGYPASSDSSDSYPYYNPQTDGSSKNLNNASVNTGNNNYDSYSKNSASSYYPYSSPSSNSYSHSISDSNSASYTNSYSFTNATGSYSAPNPSHNSYSNSYSFPTSTSGTGKPSARYNAGSHSFDASKASYAASTARSYASASSPSQFSYQRSEFKGGKPFLKIEACSCSTFRCDCGLSIPTCLEEDHREVCMNPSSPNLRCPVGCGAQFYTRGEVSNHMRACPSYEVQCKQSVEFSCQMVPCGHTVLRSENENHWREVHACNPDLGELSFPRMVPCPLQWLGCTAELDRENGEVAAHLLVCPSYEILCKHSVGYRDGPRTLNFCEKGVLRKECHAHWEETHKCDRDFGDEQFSPTMPCPLHWLGCTAELDRGSGVSHHLSDRCEIYLTKCNDFVCSSPDDESLLDSVSFAPSADRCDEEVLRSDVCAHWERKHRAFHSYKLAQRTGAAAGSPVKVM